MTEGESRGVSGAMKRVPWSFRLRVGWMLISHGDSVCVSLQIQMYQLSRLLHDYHRDLYNHLEEHEIGPSLYAAPWFLTVFASQFPLGFVARVFGECV